MQRGHLRQTQGREFLHVLFLSPHFLFLCLIVFTCSSFSFSLFFQPLFLRTPLIHRIFIDPGVLILAVFLQRSFGPHAGCLFQGCWGPFPGGVFLLSSFCQYSPALHPPSQAFILFHLAIFPTRRRCTPFLDALRFPPPPLPPFAS